MMMELAEDEMNNFAKVWVTILLSLTYCYAIGKVTQKGFTRFIAILPIIFLFFFLPLKLTSLHLCGFTAFFIAWLANFKLLLFALGKPPLCSDPPISFPRFIALTCFPIKIQNSSKSEIGANPDQKRQNKSYPPPKMSTNSQFGQYPDQKTPNKSYPSPKMSQKSQNGKYPDQKTPNKSYPSPKMSQKSQIVQYLDQKTPNKSYPDHKKFPWSYIVKGALFALILHIYSYRDRIPQKVLWIIYFFHIYFALEIILALVAKSVQLLLGLELEPQFNEPLLSTSLQDFWGRRWNLMVTSILRPTVFHPARDLSTRVVGPQLAPLLAVMGTFVVSAFMHELIFFYLGRVKPTFEVTCFFLIHGVCLCFEIVVKKHVTGKWWVPRWVSGSATAVVVLATASWLFLPPLLRTGLDTKGVQEYAMVGAFVTRLISG